MTYQLFFNILVSPWSKWSPPVELVYIIVKNNRVAVPTAGTWAHLYERDCSIRITDRLHYGLWRHQVCNAVSGCCGNVLCGDLVLKGVEQVLSPMLLIAVFNDSPQGLRPWHLFPTEVSPRYVNMMQALAHLFQFRCNFVECWQNYGVADSIICLCHHLCIEYIYI